MHERFPKHSRIGTTRMNEDNETDENGKKRGVSMEKKAKLHERKESRQPITHYLINI